MKMGKVNIPGMAPDQAAKINEMMAKRPPVMTSTVVEKIESKKLADADFAVPSDYTKRDLPGPGGMMMKPGAMKMAPAGGRTSRRRGAGGALSRANLKIKKSGVRWGPARSFNPIRITTSMLTLTHPAWAR